MLLSYFSLCRLPGGCNTKLISLEKKVKILCTTVWHQWPSASCVPPKSPFWILQTKVGIVQTWQPLTIHTISISLVVLKYPTYTNKLTDTYYHTLESSGSSAPLFVGQKVSNVGAMRVVSCPLFFSPSLPVTPTTKQGRPIFINSLLTLLW